LLPTTRRLGRTFAKVKRSTIGLYQQTLLGSKDVQNYIVSFYPQDQYALDYGHNDLFYANNAQDVVWNRILQ
jgi:hypothetical protein